MPVNLLREHWSTGMKRFDFNSAPVRSAWLGAVGFGIALAITKMPWHLTKLNYLDSLYTASYILAGVLCGALLGLACGLRKRIGLLMLAGALGFGFGLPILQMLTFSLVSNYGALPLLTLLTEPIFIGILAGIMLGIAQKSWKQSSRLAITGIIRFGLGQIAGLIVALIVWAAIQGVDSYRPGFNGELSPWVSTASMFLNVIASTIAGLIGGAALGSKAVRHPTHSHQEIA